MEASAVIFGTHAKWHLFVYFFHNCQFGCSSVRILFSAQYVMRRSTCGYLNSHSLSFEMQRSKIGQFLRSFVLVCVRLWNGLHESVFAWEGLGAFKTSVNFFSFTRLTVRCFFRHFNYFSLIFPFPGHKIVWVVL